VEPELPVKGGSGKSRQSRKGVKAIGWAGPARDWQGWDQARHPRAPSARLLQVGAGWGTAGAGTGTPRAAASPPPPLPCRLRGLDAQGKLRSARASSEGLTVGKV
jgi:hypothetical protein